MSELAPMKTWPADRFFWAVLEAPGVKAGVLPPGLAGELQDELPISVDQLNAVCLPAGEGKLLVCAARRVDLEELAHDSLSLRPQSFPDFLGPMTAVAQSAPELLTGRFEPRPLRRERYRRTILVAASILLASALISLGLTRRAAALFHHADAARVAATATIKQVSTGDTPLSLQQDLHHARSAPDRAHNIVPPDAAESFAALLSEWPSAIPCDATAVSITPTAINLTLLVSDDARPLLAAIKAPAGWRLEEPRLNASGPATRVNLTMRRAEESKR